MKWNRKFHMAGTALLLLAATCLVNVGYPLKTEASKSESSTETSEEASASAYVSPKDFASLQEENEDIYAWLDIPGTDISYPVLQHPKDDSYYLRRNEKKEDDVNGVIYSEESYNGTDFSDPVTVLYGHNMKSGAMFGTLQEMYSSEEALKKHSEVVIYLPDRELHYQVFAAVPFDNRHILYNYDMTDDRIFRLFFQEILSVKSLEAVYADDAQILTDEKALILSTCMAGNRNKRFLVCGKLIETIPTENNL